LETKRKSLDSMPSNYLDIVKECNSYLKSSSSRKQCIPFIIDSSIVGFVRNDFVDIILKASNVFVTNEHQITPERKITCIIFHSSLNSVEDRSRAINEILIQWRDADLFECLRGWRNETYWVTCESFNSPVKLTLERAAVSIFGFRSFGCHANVYCISPETGEIFMWLSRRSPSKPTWPNCLDNCAAGGLPYGSNIYENMVKELEEECGMSSELAKQILPCGMISYFAENSRGLSPEMQFLFDLEVPWEWKPIAADGEASNFYKCDILQVKQWILADDFKPNCAMVILDFLIRKGYLLPDQESDYVQIINSMHVPLYPLDLIMTLPDLD